MDFNLKRHKMVAKCGLGYWESMSRLCTFLLWCHGVQLLNVQPHKNSKMLGIDRVWRDYAFLIGNIPNEMFQCGNALSLLSVWSFSLGTSAMKKKDRGKTYVALWWPKHLWPQESPPKRGPWNKAALKQSMAEGIPFPSASGRFWGAGGGGGQSLAAAGSSTSSSSSSSPSPTSDHLPLEDAGVLAPHGEQVVVAVREAHIGHVTPVAVVHQARGLEERKHNDQ